MIKCFNHTKKLRLVSIKEIQNNLSFLPKVTEWLEKYMPILTASTSKDFWGSSGGKEQMW